MSPRLRRLTATLMWVARIALVALPLAVVYVAVGWLDDPRTLSDAVPGLAISAELPVRRAVIGVALAAIPLLPALFVLWHMQALFLQFLNGAALAQATARRFAWLGYGLFAVALTGLLARPVAGLVLSSANSPGQRMLSLSLQSNDIWLALAGGLMVVLGAVLADAARIAEEMRGFV